ncbi:MAG: hypothetical protein IJV17_06165 [Prevotella sp.]|nr:hypothetical protein [Prevotella sp.]
MKIKLYLTVLLAMAWVGTFAVNGDVTLERSDRNCTIRNDLVSVYINSSGEITSFLLYKDGDGNFSNSVQLINGTGAKGYFSFAMNNTNTNYSISEFYVKQNTVDVVEVQYVTNWRSGIRWVMDYIVCRGVAGVYHYVQVEGSASSGSLSEARMGLRVSPTLFNYAYVNEQAQGTLPTPSEIAGGTKVTDATYQLSDASIYTKYDYAAFQKDDAVHGLMGDQVGVWMITPTTEWLNGGVMRQDLTVHATETTPILLRHFHGNHFGGAGVTYASGQKKLYGPHLIYVNQSTSSDVATAHSQMVADAKERAATEQSTWPNYSWLRDTECKKRGTVTGKITMSAEDAAYFGTTKMQVVLAQPGSKPMLQGDGYQFWAETDTEGNFNVNNVRAGDYSLYAYALNGSATGYFIQDGVSVSDGNTTALGTMTWTPDADRYDEVLWQIGEADHLAAGYKMSGQRRAYGQWNSVPTNLTYTVGTSTPANDWYYAQCHNGTWTIKYNLTELPTYPLRLTIATAGAANAKITVRSNETSSSSGIGVFRPNHDGSVSRSATLAGRDSLIVFDIPVSRLQVGENNLYLNVWGLGTDELGNDLGGVLYDIIKLEKKNSTVQVITEEASMGFNGETTDNSSGLTAITNYNNTGFYLRGAAGLSIPMRVPGKDTRSFTFSDGTTYSSQNFVTLKSQTKNDYTLLPAANGDVVEKSRLNIGFQTTVPGMVYVAFQSTDSPAEGNKLRLALNGTVVKEASLTVAAAKTARLDVLEYQATEGGTFFIDAYGKDVNVFYVKFVPTEDPESAVGATSHWNFNQYAVNDYLVEGSGSGAMLDYNGLYLHVNNNHTVQAKTSTLSEAKEIGGVSYHGTVPSVFFSGGAGTVAKNYPASSERHNTDAFGLDVTTAGTFYALVQAPDAARTFTFNFIGVDDATTYSFTNKEVKVISYHATAAGPLMLKANGSFYLIAAAFLPDSETSATMSVDITSAGYVTFCAAQNYTVPEGLTAYKVSAVNPTEVTMDPITTIPACTGVVLKGEEGSYMLTSTATADAVGTNYLVANMADYALAATYGSYYHYTLAAGPTFKKSSGMGMLAASKAFLRTTVEASSPSRSLDLNFGGSTGINEVLSPASEANSIIFNLSGQRVAQPRKGLYIINGKKVMIK